MSAVNSFRLSFELLLFFSIVDYRGGCSEFCLPAGEPLWDWLTEGMIYDSGSPVLCHELYEVCIYDGKALDSNLNSCDGIFYNFRKLSPMQ